MAMKTGRRGFFGLVGGAALAGPSAAKAATQGIAGSLSHLGPGMAPKGPPWYGGVDSINVASRGLSQAVSISTDWKLHEIASLRRFISGQLTDEEIHEQLMRKLEVRRTLIDQNTQALRSVSTVRKVEMFHRNLLADEHERERENKRGYLARLLKEMAS